ncbi:hypothetical protein [Micromonospora inositola]|uniref:Uncharacterized protein n=1 Tax=Micromonospora inositola TaxID=47865 RepID=A0A1C5K5K1_9ACTN|nr:hypothetical protein [Micromonospora inositola]SCG77676.1 hypothetical protein GA0070613_6342 [Micromonospora inositola]
MTIIREAIAVAERPPIGSQRRRRLSSGCGTTRMQGLGARLTR